MCSKAIQIPVADRKFATRITFIRSWIQRNIPDINNSNKVKIRTVIVVFLEGKLFERENFVVYLTSREALNTPISTRHC